MSRDIKAGSSNLKSKRLENDQWQITPGPGRGLGILEEWWGLRWNGRCIFYLKGSSATGEGPPSPVARFVKLPREMEVSRLLCKIYQFLNTGNSFKAANSSAKHCEPTLGGLWPLPGTSLSLEWLRIFAQTICGTQGRYVSCTNKTVHCEDGTEGSWKPLVTKCWCDWVEDGGANSPGDTESVRLGVSKQGWRSSSKPHRAWAGLRRMSLFLLSQRNPTIPLRSRDSVNLCVNFKLSSSRMLEKKKPRVRPFISLWSYWKHRYRENTKAKTKTKKLFWVLPYIVTSWMAFKNRLIDQNKLFQGRIQTIIRLSFLIQ